MNINSELVLLFLLVSAGSVFAADAELSKSTRIAPDQQATIVDVEQKRTWRMIHELRVLGYRIEPAVTPA